MQESYTQSELEEKLKEFEAELRKAGFKESTLNNYLSRSKAFVRWLDGGYAVKPPSTSR